MHDELGRLPQRSIMSPKRPTTYHFAQSVLDAARRSLVVGDVPVPLTPKTFDLLLYFVSNPGRILPKDELLSALWPDAFVEESNLAQQMSLLRKALAEAGVKESLIITIPGRGYQFVAPVESVFAESTSRDPEFPNALPSQAADAEMILQAIRSKTTVVVEKSSTEMPAPKALPAPSIFAGTWFRIATTAVLLVAAAVGVYAWMHRPRPVLRKVLLAQFDNHTGESIFDDLLETGLRIDLEQSPFIEVMSHSMVAEALESMKKPDSTALTADVAREVCERENYQVLLSGSLVRVGSEFLLSVEATSCATGESIAAGKISVHNESEVLGAMDTLSRKLRGDLGESRHQIAEFQVPLVLATTSSLQALRAYTQGLEALDSGDGKGAQILFERAIGLDATFASAWRALGLDYYERGDFVQATASIQRAYELRAHTTERERFDIEIANNAFGLWDFEGAIASMQLYNRTYPDNAENWYGLARMYSALGENSEAIESGEQGYRLDPRSGNGLDILCRVYRRADRFADAKRIAAASVALGKDNHGIHSSLFKIAFIENDQAAMKRESEWGLSHQQVAQTLTDLGFAAASLGKMHEAESFFGRARREGIRNGDSEFGDTASMWMAGILIESDLPDRARTYLKQMTSDAIDPGTAAYFWAQVGEPERAQKEIALLASTNTHNTLNIYFDLPELKAILDRKAHKPAEAVAELEPSRKYILRDYGLPYQLATAEAEAGMLDKAAQDYRLILAHPGIDPLWEHYSLAQVGLARVLARQKDYNGARTEYQAFLGRWKDADADVPLYQQARRELAALR
jgi:DNA-binding winged helix-turn-helix (wHTH) protein/tetratricopeptide (TPR) repeat protein